MKTSMNIAVVWCLFSSCLLSSKACYASEQMSTAAMLSPAIVVSAPKRAFSPIDPLGYDEFKKHYQACLLYTSPSPRDKRQSRMPSSA